MADTKTKKKLDTASAPAAPAAPKEITVDESFTGLVLRLREARNDKRDAEDREDQAKQEIIARMGPARVAVFMRLPILRINRRARTSLDYEIIKTAFPEAYEAAVKTSEYDVITIL